MTTQEHILNHIAEECAEVAHRCSKALRFGIREVQDGQTLTNADRLRNELIDLMACVELAENIGIFREIVLNDDCPEDDAQVKAKIDKIKKYMQRSIEHGCVHEAHQQA